MTAGLLGVLAPLGPGSIAGRRQAELPYPLQDDALSLFAWGRLSLYAGLRSLGLGAGDQILAPAYHHGSEIEAIVQTGAECRFYLGTSDLQPDEDELEALLTPRVRALHLTHYLGFPQDCARWRRWCDERELFLIEDAAQAWLASDGRRPLGSVGDVSIFCLYKTVPVPDGSALVSRSSPEPAPSPAPSGFVGVGKKAALWSAQRSTLLARLAQHRLGGDSFDPEAAMALGELGAPSRATGALLTRFAYSRVRERRREHYRRLLRVLGGRVQPPFDQLPDGATPWLFPLTADDKTGLLAHLRRHRIIAYDLWSVPHRRLQPEHASAHARRRGTSVGLPVHQELGVRDMDRIATAAASWYG